MCTLLMEQLLMYIYNHVMLKAANIYIPQFSFDLIMPLYIINAFVNELPYGVQSTIQLNEIQVYIIDMASC